MGWNETMNEFIGGGTKPHKDDSEARKYLDQASGAYDGMGAPSLARVGTSSVSSRPVATHQATTTAAGPTAFNGISTDPAARQAQQAQMAALSNLAKNGGRNAASDANLAQIQQAANANAQGQRGAIMQNAQARGMGGSSNSLLAQLSASQNATNNQSAQDMMVRGQDQNTALQAGMGAAQIGSNMENQQFNQQAQRATAADALARFNAGNQNQTSAFNAGQLNSMGQADANRDQSAQQFNSGQYLRAQEFNSGVGQQEFADKMGIAAGRQKGADDGLDYWSKKYKEDQQDKGMKTAGMLKIGGAVVGGIYGGPAGAAAGGAAGGAVGGAIDDRNKGDDEGGDDEEDDGEDQIAAARGGLVPGMAAVRGDSPRNDTVRVHTSPGEVIVPRTLAHSGDSQKIANFVKHPPPISGSKDKEAMLSALKNLRSRR